MIILNTKINTKVIFINLRKNSVCKMSTLSNHIRIPPVIGRYKVLRQLGKGGFAVVVLGQDQKTGEYVAIKIVNRDEIQKHNIMIYLENELRLCSRFDHPSIVKVFDIIYQPDIIMIIMEFFPNGDIQTLISHGFHLSFEENLRIAYQILDGLVYLHKRGICHRDIKPENIMFDEKLNPKLVDFGLAKENSSALSTFCGTPWYMAPEVMLTTEYDGRKADVWAFGVTLHMLVTGNLPFPLRADSQFIKDIQQNKLAIDVQPKGILGELISNALIFDPKQRWSSEDLLLYLQQNQVQARGISIAEFNNRRSASKQISLPKLIIKAPIPLKNAPRLVAEKSQQKFNLVVRKRLL